MVQAHRTSSNLLEPHQDRASRACSVLSYEFRVVRLYRTFSSYFGTGETRFAGCLCTSSAWFTYIEPPRTFSNHIIAEIPRCVEFFHMRSECFDSTEPSLPTSSQKKKGVQGARTLVRGGSSASNLLEPSRTTGRQSYYPLPTHWDGSVAAASSCFNSCHPGCKIIVWTCNCVSLDPY